jgi:hypothetical protein
MVDLGYSLLFSLGECFAIRLFELFLKVRQDWRVSLQRLRQFNNLDHAGHPKRTLYSILNSPEIMSAHQRC